MFQDTEFVVFCYGSSSKRILSKRPLYPSLIIASQWPIRSLCLTQSGHGPIGPRLTEEYSWAACETHHHFSFFQPTYLLLLKGLPQIVFSGDKFKGFHLLKYELLMVHLDSKLQSRDITFSTKVCIVKAMVFLVVM